MADLRIPDHRALFLGGRFVAPIEGRMRTVVNPADGSVLADIAEAGAADVAAAVQMARKAFVAV